MFTRKPGLLWSPGLFLLLAAGCSHAPLGGVIFTDLQMPEAATANPAGNREGQSCAKSVLGLVAWGDASIENARRNGGITMISSVDTSYKSYLGLGYAVRCTVVRGR